MKEQTMLLRYTCDQCKKTTIVRKGVHTGTPFSEKWIQMYLKVKPTDAKKTELHFCGGKCAFEYLLERSYGIKEKDGLLEEFFKHIEKRYRFANYYNGSLYEYSPTVKDLISSFYNTKTSRMREGVK